MQEAHASSTQPNRHSYIWLTVTAIFAAVITGFSIAASSFAFDNPLFPNIPSIAALSGLAMGSIIMAVAVFSVIRRQNSFKNSASYTLGLLAITANLTMGNYLVETLGLYSIPIVAALAVAGILGIAYSSLQIKKTPIRDFNSVTQQPAVIQAQENTLRQPELHSVTEQAPQENYSSTPASFDSSLENFFSTPSPVIATSPINIPPLPNPLPPLRGGEGNRRTPNPLPPLRGGEGNRRTPNPLPPLRGGEGNRRTPNPLPPLRGGEGNGRTPNLLPPLRGGEGNRRTPNPLPPLRGGEGNGRTPNLLPPLRGGEGNGRTPNLLPPLRGGEGNGRTPNLLPPLRGGEGNGRTPNLLPPLRGGEGNGRTPNLLPPRERDEKTRTQVQNEETFPPRERKRKLKKTEGTNLDKISKLIQEAWKNDQNFALPQDKHSTVRKIVESLRGVKVKEILSLFMQKEYRINFIKSFIEPCKANEHVKLNRLAIELEKLRQKLAQEKKEMAKEIATTIIPNTNSPKNQISTPSNAEEDIEATLLSYAKLPIKDIPLHTQGIVEKFFFKLPAETIAHYMKNTGLSQVHIICLLNEPSWQKKKTLRDAVGEKIARTSTPFTDATKVVDSTLQITDTLKEAKQEVLGGLKKLTQITKSTLMRVDEYITDHKQKTDPTQLLTYLAEEKPDRTKIQSLLKKHDIDIDTVMNTLIDGLWASKIDSAQAQSVLQMTFTGKPKFTQMLQRQITRNANNKTAMDNGLKCLGKSITVEKIVVHAKKSQLFDKNLADVLIKAYYDEIITEDQMREICWKYCDLQGDPPKMQRLPSTLRSTEEGHFKRIMNFIAQIKIARQQPNSSFSPSSRIASNPTPDISGIGSSVHLSSSEPEDEAKSVVDHLFGGGSSSAPIKSTTDMVKHFDESEVKKNKASRTRADQLLDQICINYHHASKDRINDLIQNLFSIKSMDTSTLAQMLVNRIWNNQLPDTHPLIERIHQETISVPGYNSSSQGKFKEVYQAIAQKQSIESTLKKINSTNASQAIQEVALFFKKYSLSRENMAYVLVKAVNDKTIEEQQAQQIVLAYLGLSQEDISRTDLSSDQRQILEKYHQLMGLFQAVKKIDMQEYLYVIPKSYAFYASEVQKSKGERTLEDTVIDEICKHPDKMDFLIERSFRNKDITSPMLAQSLSKHIWKNELSNNFALKIKRKAVIEGFSRNSFEYIDFVIQNKNEIEHKLRELKSTQDKEKALLELDHGPISYDALGLESIAHVLAKAFGDKVITEQDAQQYILVRFFAADERDSWNSSNPTLPRKAERIERCRHLIAWFEAVKNEYPKKLETLDSDSTHSYSV